MSREAKIDYGKCTSSIDQISQLEWAEEAPSIFINLKRFEGKPGLLNCYNSENLRMWLNNKDNYFAEWRQREDAPVLEDNGAGGAPNLQGPRYVRLYTPDQTVYLVVDDEVRQLRSGKQDFVMYDTKYLGRIRLGNLRGLLTVVGALHGQVPGEDVYILTTVTPTLGHAEYEETEAFAEAQDDVDVEDAARNVPIDTDLNLLLSDDEEEEEEGGNDDEEEDDNGAPIISAEDRRSELLAAAVSRDEERLSAAISNLTIDDVNAVSNEALLKAIKAGWAEGTAMLIQDIEYDLDSPIYDGQRYVTPLVYAINWQKLAIAQLLLDSGAMVEARDNSALKIAIRDSYYSAVSLLMKNVGGPVSVRFLEEAIEVAYSAPNNACANLIMRSVAKRSNFSALSSRDKIRYNELSQVQIDSRDISDCIAM